jgi:hypothetical protein
MISAGSQKVVKQAAGNRIIIDDQDGRLILSGRHHRASPECPMIPPFG